MFRIKICGVRLKKDVQAVDEAGADAIGLNFFHRSIRYLDPASESTAALSCFAKECGLIRVGVFVNEPADAIGAIADRVGLDAVQLHGDETPKFANELLAAGRSIIRAIKLPRGPFPVELLSDLVAPWSAAGCHLLLDVDAGASHGGSGKTLDWTSVAQWAETISGQGWTLAGGLRQENVADAIVASGAQSVDTASGVECPKGIKNQGRIAQFVRTAETGWREQQ